MTDSREYPPQAQCKVTVQALCCAADMYPGMTLGCLKSFMGAYLDGGRSNMADLAVSIGVPYQTFARHSDILGVQGTRATTPVYGLFEKTLHANSRRSKALVPTQAGLEFARALGLPAYAKASPAVAAERAATRVVAPGAGRKVPGPEIASTPFGRDGA